MRGFIHSAFLLISSNSWLTYLIDMSVSLSVMILVLVGIRVFMKRMPRIAMYILWFVVVLRMLFPLSVSGIYHLVPERVSSTVSETQQSMKVETIVRRLENNRQNRAGSTETRSSKKQSVPEQKTFPEVGAETQVHQDDGLGIEADEWIVMIWFAGCLGFAVSLMVSLIRTKKRLSDARHLRDNVYTHPLVVNSFVAGIFKPKIYISERISLEDQEYVLCHENIHIKRKDYLVKPFMFLLCSVYWFNPLMWLAYSLMMKDMEVSCDEAVIRRLGEEQRARYSYLLISLTDGHKIGVGSYTAFSMGVLRDRIRSIMKYRKPSAATSVVLVAAVLLCSCSLISSPEKTTVKTPVQDSQTGKEKYTEFTYYWTRMLTPFENYEVGGYPFMDAAGNIVCYPMLSGKQPAKMKLVDGEWQEEKLTWLDSYQKFFGGKEMSPQGYWRGNDGCLYAEFSDREIKEGKDGDPEEFQVVVRDEYLLKIDEKNGTVTPMSLGEEPGVIPDGMNFNELSVFGDGNLCLTGGYTESGEALVGIYDGRTGEKIADAELRSDIVSDVIAGDDFFAYVVKNRSSGRLEAVICDEMSGAVEDTVDTGIEYTEETAAVDFAFGVWENDITIACRSGIYEMGYGEETFHKVVDCNTDTVFYLQDEDMVFHSYVNKNDQGEYVVVRYPGGEEGGEEKICVYGKKG